MTSIFPGKPDEVRPERRWRQFKITYDGGSEIIEADRIRFDVSHVSFWEVIDNPDHDHLIVAIPSNRVMQVKEL